MSKQISIHSASIMVVVAFSAFWSGSSHAQGWLQKATGVKTPDPIRKIAPNGLSIGKGQESTSGTMEYIPPRIDSNGDVWSGTGNSNHSQTKIGKARPVLDSNGRAYWRYENLTPVRAPKYDRLASNKNTQGSIEFDNQVQKKKLPTKKPAVSQNGPPQGGLTKQQQEQAALANAIGQLLQGISESSQQNRP
jgi:hypothetical protein